MIEMLGVLAIIGVLSVGGIAGYSKAMYKYKINKTIDLVSHIATNIRIIYAQQTSYNGLNEFSPIITDIVPQDAIASDGRLTHPLAKAAEYGGRMHIKSAYSDEDKWFHINLLGLSKEACVELATKDWGSASSSGFVGLVVETNDFSTPVSVRADTASYGYVNTIGNTVPLPLSPAVAAEACQCSENGCGVGLNFK